MTTKRSIFLGRAAMLATAILGSTFARESTASADQLCVFQATDDPSFGPRDAINITLGLDAGKRPGDTVTNFGFQTNPDFTVCDQVYLALDAYYRADVWTDQRILDFIRGGGSFFTTFEFFGIDDMALFNRLSTGLLTVPTTCVGTGCDSAVDMLPGCTNEPVQIPGASALMHCPLEITSLPGTSAAANCSGIPEAHMLQQRAFNTNLATGGWYDETGMINGLGRIAFWGDVSRLPNAQMWFNIITLLDQAPDVGSTTCSYCEFGSACSDGNECTSADACSAQGLCSGTDVASGTTCSGGSCFPTADASISCVNAIPTWVDDTGTCPEDGTTTIPVLDNDTGLIDDPFTVTCGQGTHGAVTVSSTNVVSYTPVANYNGPDSWDCIVTDANGDTDSGTVTVTVTPVDDGAPVCVDDTTTCPQGGTTTVPVLGNDTAVDGMVVVTCGQGTHGTTIVNTDNTVTYTGDDGFTGSDTFTYTVTDADGDIDSGTVTIVVGDVLTGYPDDVSVSGGGCAARGGDGTNAGLLIASLAFVVGRRRRRRA